MPRLPIQVNHTNFEIEQILHTINKSSRKNGSLAKLRETEKDEFIFW
jgi:hypothetical protein